MTATRQPPLLTTQESPPGIVDRIRSLDLVKWTRDERGWPMIAAALTPLSGPLAGRQVYGWAIRDGAGWVGRLCIGPHQDGWAAAYILIAPANRRSTWGKAEARAAVTALLHGHTGGLRWRPPGVTRWHTMRKLAGWLSERCGR